MTESAVSSTSSSSDACHVVLLSGGVDSAATLHHVLRASLTPSCLFVDYGQPALAGELRSARAVSAHYEVVLDQVSITGAPSVEAGEVPGRNALLVLTGLFRARRFPATIYLGIHSGTPYFDCSPAFVEIMNRLLDGYADGQVALRTPFLRFNKRDIYDHCREWGVPIELTWSCESASDSACGMCLSCRDRNELNAGS